MSDKWIRSEADWFNLDDFCHIRIDSRTTKCYDKKAQIVGYYLIGEWRHSGEEVIITKEWHSKEKLTEFINHELGLSKKNSKKTL